MNDLNLNDIVNNKIHSQWLGLVDIKTTGELQNSYLLENDIQKIEVIGCEHFEVLSAGKSLWKNDLSHYTRHFDSLDLTRRGGQLTLHNPGQLIIYPQVHLKTFNFNLKTYIQFLLSVSHNTLLKLGLNSDFYTESNIGIYCDSKKVVSLGLNHSKGWISHGLSINVNNDLTKFSLFDVCGHSTTKVTSLKNLNYDISTKELFLLWITQFKTQLLDQVTVSQQVYQ